MKSIRRLFSKPDKAAGKPNILVHAPTDDTPKFGVSNAPEEWQNIRESHYRKWLGDSENVFVYHEVLPMIPHVDVHVFPPSKESGRNFFTLITSGMSDERMILDKGIDEQLARAEIIFYVAEHETRLYQTEKPWYVEAMFHFAHFPFNYNTYLAVSHTIPNGNPSAPILAGSSLTTALFLPTFFEPDEYAQEFKLGDEFVNFLWLTFLTDQETEFKLEYGIEKLVEKFTHDNFPQVFNPFRESIV